MSRAATEFDEFLTELQRVCPDLVKGFAVAAHTPPPPLSWVELAALLRTLPDNAGEDVFLDAWYAAGPGEEPPQLSNEEKSLQRAYVAELERVCPADEWTEPPFGFGLPGGLEHAVAVLRSLPDRAGALAFDRALQSSAPTDDRQD